MQYLVLAATKPELPRVTFQMEPQHIFYAALAVTVILGIVVLWKVLRGGW